MDVKHSRVRLGHDILSDAFHGKRKAKIRNQYNQIPHLTQDTIWESDNNTRKYHIQMGQEVSCFPAGYHRVARNRQDSMTDMKHKLQKRSTKEALPWNFQ